MARLSVRGLHKRYGSVAALSGVDLSVPAGGLTAVLGPSGCGKTTLLRCVAGFERLDAGEVRVGDRQVAGSGRHLPPERRRVAVVPQEGALFPHLSVAGNIRYGLSRAARRSGRVAEVLDLVGLTGYGDRMPHQLSGGQQQRVAVARALAPRPPLVLLDEPFSALDAGLRAELRRDVREALRADGATAVLVTHDQDEALSMADQVAVMREGRIVQCGTPAQVYGDPADAWVAHFVGEAVLLPARVCGGIARTSLGDLPLVTPTAGTAAVAAAGPNAAPTAAGAVAAADLATGAPDTVAERPATVLIRPEQVRVLAGDPDPDAVTAIVLRQDFFGHDAILALRLDDGSDVLARVFDQGTLGITAGQQVRLRVSGPVLAYPQPAD